MASIPIEKKFSRLGISTGDVERSNQMGYELSPDSLRKFGPSVAPKPQYKAQPQVPIVPKSSNISSCLEPSFSTLLKTHNADGSLLTSVSSSSNYENVEPYLQNEEPIYGNIHQLGSPPYLPPPPPPPAFASCDNDVDLPLPPPPDLSGYYGSDHLHLFPTSSSTEEVTSPPSPVSSSYSELRRAGCGSTTGSTSNYAPLSQASNYESLYEPIQPRPHHQHSPAGSMSSLTRPSHYTTSAYPPYGGSSSSTTYGGGSAAGGSAASLKPQASHAKGATSPVQEEEVDALTNLLVQSMDNAADPEFFGMCADCGLKVVGEGSGCTAMDRVFHIACFTCRVCNCRLQGKPFYAVDGEPHCQECYMNSLEKCCVCSEPILDRILRATGKPYHPQCFTCIVCLLCLDGIPFTVDAANRIHCIDDFHKKFAPRCSVCHDPIMPEPGQEETVRVVALDRSFHVQCYKCEDCDLVLSSEAEGRGCYPLDGRVLCKSCNAIRVNALTSTTSTEL